MHKVKRSWKRRKKEGKLIKGKRERMKEIEMKKNRIRK